MLATRAAIPSLSRLKSISRYRRLWPPPWCRTVSFPRAWRPQRDQRRAERRRLVVVLRAAPGAAGHGDHIHLRDFRLEELLHGLPDHRLGGPPIGLERVLVDRGAPHALLRHDGTADHLARIVHGATASVIRPSASRVTSTCSQARMSCTLSAVAGRTRSPGRLAADRVTV